MRLSLLGLGVLVATVLVAAPSALAMRVKVGGRVYGIMPSAGAQSAALRGAAGAAPRAPFLAPPAGWNVSYQGGPVLHTVKPYVIYWDPSGTGITARSEQVIDQYLTDVAADGGETDDTYGVGRQYYDSAGIADAGQAFSASSQAFVDTDPYPTLQNCPPQTGYTSCITDAQLRAELSAFISAQGLPTDGPSTESELPAGSPAYFLILPNAVNTCTDSTGASCSGGPAFSGPGGYCAYHDYYMDAGNVVLYSDVPFSVLTASPIKGCQADNTSASVLQAPNGDPADNLVDNLSHELNELITDPLINAWVNTGGDGNELADQCQAYGSAPDPTSPTGPVSPNSYEPTLGGSATLGTLYDQLINGHQYYTQSLWSNGQVDCAMQPAAATLTPSFTVGGAVPGQPATVDPTSSVSAAGVASASWSWGDGTSSFLPGALTTAAHTFAAAGIYDVTLTLVDGNGNLATATRQVSVGTNPSASIGALPAAVAVGSVVSFSGGLSTDPNGTAIANFNWNFGDGSTNTGVTAKHAYGAPGNYTVTLGVNDSYGFSASTTATIDVLPVGKVSLVRATHRGTSAYVLVKVTQAGTVSYAGHATRLTRPGRARIKLRLTAKQRRMLRQGRRFTLAIRLVYRPRAGRRVTVSRRLTL